MASPVRLAVPRLVTVSVSERPEFSKITDPSEMLPAPLAMSDPAELRTAISGAVVAAVVLETSSDNSLISPDVL